MNNQMGYEEYKSNQKDVIGGTNEESKYNRIKYF